MATRDTKRDLGASILAGSEELFEFYCQPCNIENIHLEAVGFCQECQEYLCDTCFKCHRKSTASRHHSLLDKSSMPKTKLTPKVTDILTERCPTHPDKVIEYFCNDHNALCCSVCLSLSHITCSKSYIPEVSDGIAGSQEYQQVRTELDKFISIATGHQKQINSTQKASAKYHTNALANIKEFRKEINKQLDKLEKDAEKEVSRLNDENVENLNPASAKCQLLLSDMKGLLLNIDGDKKTGKNNQLFLRMKQARIRLAIMDDKLKEATKYKISKYQFHQDEKVQEMMSTLSTIWSLSIRQGDSDTVSRYLRDVNVKSADDTKDCLISGIAVLTGDRIVVTDEFNKSVKLVNVKQNKVMCSVSMSSIPFGLTVVKEDQVAVALGNEEKIEIFTVSKTLSRTRTIKVPGAKMVGLQYDGQRFITLCQHPGTVKIIDMSGKVLSTFSTDSNGKPLFTATPRYIALSRDHDVLYVNDYEDHTVTCMTVDEKVISVYKHDKLKCPAGVTVDTDGSVYVCSHNTHTVHQLSPTGTLIQILLGQENGLAKWPLAIAYSDKDGKLYINSGSTSPDDRNNVKVFQLE